MLVLGARVALRPLPSVALLEQFPISVFYSQNEAPDRLFNVCPTMHCLTATAPVQISPAPQAPANRQFLRDPSLCPRAPSVNHSESRGFTRNLCPLTFNALWRLRQEETCEF